jgi:NADH dehydrogenase FAD-containing subunit
MARFIRARARPHRVAIVGGGFGGLFAARALQHAEVEVTVIDRTNHPLFQPLLYQVATDILSEGEVAPPIRDILRHQANATVLLREVVDIDVDARLLVVEALDRRTAVAHDSLILAAGRANRISAIPSSPGSDADPARPDRAVDPRYGWRSRLERSAR